MLEEKNPSESAVIAGDFSLKNKLKKLIRAKKTKSPTVHNVKPYKTNKRSFAVRRNLNKMAETDNGYEPEILVGSAKKGVRLSRRLKIVRVVVLAGIICGGAVWFIYQRNSKSQTVIDGQTYTIDPLFYNQSVNYEPSSTAIYEKQIQELEAKNKQQPTYENYLFLGQLYGNIKNKQQAIANYKQAKEYVTKDQYYQANIDDLDRKIQLIEASK